jgi:hypothetical protein
MPANHTATASRPPTTRAAVTNGSRHYLTTGGELSTVGRRCRDLFELITSDRGGADRLSEGQRQLVRRAAQISIECERMEAARAEGGDLDVEQYVTLTNALCRVLGKLGLGRKAIDVTPSLQSIIEGTAE